MPEDQEAQHWFVLLNNKRYGPYTLSALVKGVEKGVIGQSAGVWRPGWDEWRTAGEVPELFAPEPPAVETFAEKQEPEAQAEAPATSPEEPEETQEPPEVEPAEPEETEPMETTEDRGGTEEAAHSDSAATESAATDSASAASADAPSMAPVPIPPVSMPPLSTAPEPAVADPEPPKAEPEIESPREVRESGRRNRFRDGPDLFGRGFARSDPVRLEPIKSDTAKPDPKLDQKLDPARPEVGKLDLPKLDFPKLDIGAAPHREAAPGLRNPGARNLLTRAIPSELGAPDIGSRNQPLTDAALRVSVNTMLASADVAPPRKGSPKEPGVEDDEEVDAENVPAPARDPAATKPLIAVERLSDIASAARGRKADIKPDIALEREVPKFPAGPPPISAPEPVPEPEEARRAGGLMAVILSVFATLLVVCAAAWAASALGLIRVEFLPGSSGRAAAALQSLGGSSAVHQHATLDGLPDIVANMPAVIALKMADPDAFGKFVKRFTAVYHDNEPDDVILTQTRTAVRKSIKHMLANATNESLLEVTEVNLAYMRGLAQSNAGSCVALSDESKGAVLDANLARDFPPLFEREMAVLERVISNAGGTQTAPTEAEVRPYLEAVFADLKKKPVQMQLLGRDKLSEAEYAPYCDLVIAFYEGVRGLPFNDAVKLLRNLYAAAASDPDKS
jgi:GYF domain 2